MSTRTKKDMQNVTTHRLPRSRRTASFTHFMASADEEDFPYVDRELDPDSGDNNGSKLHLASPCTPELDAIIEDDEVSNDELADIVDYRAPKYCHDPHFAGHPECHNRQISDTYVFRAVDAVEEFRLRFAATHDGGDSIKHYRDWRRLKWEYGETMVHGGSSLRTEVPVEEEVVDVRTHQRFTWDAIRVQNSNATHEDFVEHYLLRQRALRGQAAHAKRSQVDADHTLVSAGTITGNPELLVPPTLGEGELSFFPTEAYARPVNNLIARRSCDEMSLSNSVSSKPTLGTKKPSYGSAGPTYSGSTNPLAVEADAHSSHHRRVASMPRPNSPAPESGEEATEPLPQNTVVPETHNTIIAHDQASTFPTRKEVQLSNVGYWADDLHSSLLKQAAGDTHDLYSTLFNDLHPKHRRQHWSSKAKSLVKRRLIMFSARQSKSFSGLRGLRRSWV